MSRVQEVLRLAVAILLIAGCAEKTAPIAAPRAVASRSADLADNGRPLVRDFGIDVPSAYYGLSRTFTIRTGGFTPPVQARAYGYMGLALYEALVSGMPESPVGCQSAERHRRATPAKGHT